MTEEEVAEYNQLCDEYNRLVAENAQLAAEIDLGVDNCYIVADNMLNVGKAVTSDVQIVSADVDDANEVIDRLQKCLYDVTEHYFLFKNLSEASKKLTQYNDEYFTKFKFYNELRRITLGYVIGIDSHIVSNESLRKKVEKAYLQNTDYWLAYAITAVMLWASNEQEAAYRALNKSLNMDYYKACVFFMLVNLRFGRYDVARNWFITLLDKTDVNNMSSEWKFVLQAYLKGTFSNDKEFTDLASGYFEKMIEQTQATTADFSKAVSQKGYSFASSYIHVTDEEYLTLMETCPDYKEMKTILSSMEKVRVMAKYYDDVYNMADDTADNTFEEIENVLYDLINGYDEKEFEVIKGIKLNEAIMAAKGDMNLANQKFTEMYGEITAKHTFGDLMIKWAFSEDQRDTNIIVKRFSLSYLKDSIAKGVCNYFEDQKNLIKDRYKLTISAPGSIADCVVECDENSYERASETVTKHFSKNKISYIMSDKYFKIFLFMCAGALLLLGISALAFKSAAFSVLLTLGITLGIVGGFLVWRRWVDLGNEIAEKCRLALTMLRKSVDEIGAWKKACLTSYEAISDLQSAIERF